MPELELKEKSIEVIVFKLNDPESKREENFGVDIKQIQEVRNVEEITRLPNAPEYVKGVMNLRGQIITVIDIKKKLGFTSTGQSETSILITKINDQIIGFLIDDVDEVIRIKSDEIDSNPTELINSGKYLKGVAKGKGIDRLIILLDLKELIDENDLVQETVTN